MLERRHIPEVAVQPLRVVPVHPSQCRELEIIDRFPRPRLRWPAHQLGLVVAVHRLSESVVIAVANGPDRGRRPDLGKTLTVTNGRELTARIAIEYLVF